MQTKQCKVCNVEKAHIFVRLAGYNGKTNKVYKSESGRTWQGRMCGDCWMIVRRHGVNKIGATRKHLKEKRQLGLLGPALPKGPVRYCRGCSGSLTADRWLDCYQCRVLLPEENFGTAYMTPNSGWVHS